MFFVYWITDEINICISGQEAFELGYRNGGGHMRRIIVWLKRYG